MRPIDADALKEKLTEIFESDPYPENEYMDGWTFAAFSRDELKPIIDDAPTIEAEPRWIPVTERLPKETGTYLVTLEYKEHGTGITTLWFHGSLGWDLRVADVVTAWMPLPEPYREVKE